MSQKDKSGQRMHLGFNAITCMVSLQISYWDKKYKKETAHKRSPQQPLPFYRRMTHDMSPLYRNLSHRYCPHQDLPQKSQGCVWSLHNPFCFWISVLLFCFSSAPYPPSLFLLSRVHSLFVYSNSHVHVPKDFPLVFLS